MTVRSYDDPLDAGRLGVVGHVEAVGEPMEILLRHGLAESVRRSAFSTSSYSTIVGAVIRRWGIVSPVEYQLIHSSQKAA